jgi:predicted ester cyclase
LCTLACFYRYAEEEGLIESSPAVHVRRPRLDYQSHATGLDRNEVVVTQFRMSNTHTGTYKGVPATGVRVTTSVCNILTFDTQGRVVAEETYYDDLQTMLRLGAVRQA